MADTRPARTALSTSRTRSRSRPSRPSSPPLHRILSNQFPDDHSVYHHENGEGVHVDTDVESLHKTETERRRAELEDESDSAADEAELSEKDGVTHEVNGETTILEIRNGIVDERDVEAQPAQLEKKKSSRSIKDPNLVGSSAMLESASA